MSDRRKIVFDSYAVLSFIENEAGVSRVESVLELARKEQVRVFMSEVNLGEVLYITERENDLRTAHDVLSVLEQLPIEFVPATRTRVLASAHLKAQYAMSYADCFAAGLAIEYDACILTGDREFRAVEDQVEIYWLP